MIYRHIKHKTHSKAEESQKRRYNISQPRKKKIEEGSYHIIGMEA